jgi:predicted deacetylase
MRIAIRLDDITADMNWEKFLRFKDLMDRYGVKPLLGIVPDSKDPKLSIDPPRADFWEYVKERRDQDGWTLCMHGCHHVYTTDKGGLLPLNRQSEFAGEDYEEQRDRLRKGRDILRSHGIETSLFMAPGHTYDLNTLMALRSLGFTGLTDGFGSRPYRYEDMIFYPISFRKADSLKKSSGVTTFVVHCNSLEEQDFAAYEEIFRDQDMMPYSEMLEQPAGYRTTLARRKEHLMALAKRSIRERGERRK